MFFCNSLNTFWIRELLFSSWNDFWFVARTLFFNSFDRSQGSWFHICLGLFSISTFGICLNFFLRISVIFVKILRSSWHRLNAITRVVSLHSASIFIYIEISRTWFCDVDFSWFCMNVMFRRCSGATYIFMAIPQLL